MKKASVIGSLVILLGLFIAITAVAEEQAIPHAPKPSTRMVPLRVVQPLNCVPGSTGCKPNLEYKKLWEVVDRTNTIYKPAGLQFWLKSVEYYYIPKIYMGNTADYRWDEFKHYSGQEDNILDIFPNMPADAYYDHDIKYMGLWLSNATALYGDPDELLVWLLWGGGGVEWSISVPRAYRFHPGQSLL